MHADFAFSYHLGAEKSTGRVTYNELFVLRMAINASNKGGGGVGLLHDSNSSSHTTKVTTLAFHLFKMLKFFGNQIKLPLRPNILL